MRRRGGPRVGAARSQLLKEVDQMSEGKVQAEIIYCVP
jgi:hypothetical protein